MIDEAPEGELPRDLPAQPAVFAPDVDPGWVAEIAVELRKKAGLPKEPSGAVANGPRGASAGRRTPAAKQPANRRKPRAKARK